MGTVGIELANPGRNCVKGVSDHAIEAYDRGKRNQTDVLPEFRSQRKEIGPK